MTDIYVAPPDGEPLDGHDPPTAEVPRGRSQRRPRTPPPDRRPAAGAATLEARDACAWFGDHLVLEGVYLVMPAGEVTALIGPSGCGKSTFLRLLNRMHELVPGAAMDGEILLDGDDIYATAMRPQQVRTRIGMVFQKPNPFPAMSIRDNVLAGLKLTRIRCTDKEALVEQSLRRASLWKEVRDRLDQPGGGPVGWPAAAALHRPVAGRRPERAVDGRALLGPRPDLDPTGRGDHRRAARRGHHRHRHPQHAAGPPGLGPLRLLPGRGERAGLRGRTGPHRRRCSRTPTTPAPSTT